MDRIQKIWNGTLLATAIVSVLLHMAVPTSTPAPKETQIDSLQSFQFEMSRVVETSGNVG